MILSQPSFQGGPKAYFTILPKIYSYFCYIVTIYLQHYLLEPDECS